MVLHLIALWQQQQLSKDQRAQEQRLYWQYIKDDLVQIMSDEYPKCIRTIHRQTARDETTRLRTTAVFRPVPSACGHTTYFACLGITRVTFVTPTERTQQRTPLHRHPPTTLSQRSRNYRVCGDSKYECYPPFASQKTLCNADEMNPKTKENTVSPPPTHL